MRERGLLHTAKYASLYQEVREALDLPATQDVPQESLDSPQIEQVQNQMNEYRYYLRQMEPEVNRQKYEQNHQQKKKRIF